MLSNNGVKNQNLTAYGMYWHVFEVTTVARKAVPARQLNSSPPRVWNERWKGWKEKWKQFSWSFLYCSLSCFLDTSNWATQSMVSIWGTGLGVAYDHDCSVHRYVDGCIMVMKRKKTERLVYKTKVDGIEWSLVECSYTDDSVMLAE